MPDAPSILVVEYQPDIRAVIIAMLEQCGYRAAGAGEASTGAEIMRATRPALVIANAGFRGSDPVWLAHAMEIPVLLISGVLPTIEQRGGIPFLLKPFRLSELERKIKELLQESR